MPAGFGGNKGMPVGLKSLLRAKTGLLNGYCMLPCAVSVEIYARQGFDLVTIDLQHGLIGYDTALPLIQALTACDVVPMVRIPWLEPGIIMKLLDAGALGVTCPMINTAEQAEALVAYASYPPRGVRSLGPIRRPSCMATTTCNSSKCHHLDTGDDRDRPGGPVMSRELQPCRA